MSIPDDRPIRVVRSRDRPAPAHRPKAAPRPAPAHGPKAAPRPASRAPKTSHAGDRHGLCARCREQPGEFLWTAKSPSAIRLLPKLLLCRRCTQALKSMLDGYMNKIRQKAAAQKGTASPPAL